MKRAGRVVQGSLAEGHVQWTALVHQALAPGPAITRDDLLLMRDLAGQAFRPAGPPAGVSARPGAVLLLLYPDGDDLRLPLTVRSNTLPTHRGEVSLPGGATDPDDADPAATALRECHEELGVAPESVALWGQLTPIYIPPSNFSITPVVGACTAPPALTVNASEVSAVITTTLRQLLDPATVVSELWTLRGAQVHVPFFVIDGYKVWGATALILSEFAARLRRALATLGAATGGML